MLKIEKPNRRGRGGRVMVVVIERVVVLGRALRVVVKKKKMVKKVWRWV